MTDQALFDEMVGNHVASIRIVIRRTEIVETLYEAFNGDSTGGAIVACPRPDPEPTWTPEFAAWLQAGIRRVVTAYVERAERANYPLGGVNIDIVVHPFEHPPFRIDAANFSNGFGPSNADLDRLDTLARAAGLPDNPRKTGADFATDLGYRECLHDWLAKFLTANPPPEEPDE
jgi:hypothetical protein